MRNKTQLQHLTQEVTALDMAVRLLRQQVQGQLHTIIVLKKALNAPMAADEQTMFDNLAPSLQNSTNKSADLIARTMGTSVNNQTVTYSYVQPTKPTKRIKAQQPLSRTRWSVKEETTLRRMVKEGKSFTEIATTLQRTNKACEQHWHIIKKG